MEGEASRWLENGGRSVFFLITFQRSLALKEKRKEELQDPKIPFPMRSTPVCGQGEKIKTEDEGVSVIKEAGSGDSDGLGLGLARRESPGPSVSLTVGIANEVGLPLSLTEPLCPALYPAKHNEN